MNPKHFLFLLHIIIEASLTPLLICACSFLAVFRPMCQGSSSYAIVVLQIHEAASRIEINCRWTLSNTCCYNASSQLQEDEHAKPINYDKSSASQLEQTEVLFWAYNCGLLKGLFPAFRRGSE